MEPSEAKSKQSSQVKLNLHIIVTDKCSTYIIRFFAKSQKIYVKRASIDEKYAFPLKMAVIYTNQLEEKFQTVNQVIVLK